MGNMCSLIMKNIPFDNISLKHSNVEIKSSILLIFAINETIN